MFKNKAWIICGDFNEVLEGGDHSLFASSPTISHGMRDFQDLDGVICKKLDRVLISKSWLHQYHQSYSVFESGGCSDHMRCRFYISEEEKRVKKPFKFMKATTNHPDDHTFLAERWTKSPPLFHSISAMHRFSKKLKGLQPLLRSMGKQQVGHITIRTKEAYKCLCELQMQTMAHPSPHAISAEADAYAKWQRLSDIEESYLKQKAKLHWLKVGDQNNKAFHIPATLREQINTIREILCDDGRLVDKLDHIKLEAESDKQLLTHDVTNEEIRRVLFSMPSSKSPGPDGFTTEFFKESWSIVGEDFLVAVQSFFQTGFLPKGVNSTILALIPKKKKAKVMKDYRPISCCNVIYKVISKILANRLKIILPKFITPNQSVFVKDRLLMENVLFATKIIKDYHKDTVSPRCAMQIDISKTFDSVQWDFLLTTLRALDIPKQFVLWIKTCITTASFSVQVNGELAGYFGSLCGLRQGCSLSPYLFVICMNVLSCKLDKAAQEKVFSFHPNCKHLQLTHLCFADDLMVFVDGDKTSIQGALRVFDDFAIHTELNISLEKSILYMAGVSTDQKREILQQLPFALGSLPVRYLGLPLLPKHMSSSDYLPLLENIRSKINSWTARTLSFAGRLQLLRSVIFSITNFWISAYRLPKACIHEIDQLCSAFLWSSPTLNAKKIKLTWTEVCLPKSEGGLGLRSLCEANNVSVLKLIWRIISAKGSLWVNWIHRYLIRSGSFWSEKDNTVSGSWIWKKLLKYKDLAKQFHRIEVYNGESTSFWFDDWSSLGRLYEKVGDRGCLSMGIPISSTVAEAMDQTRRRRSRNEFLSLIEDELHKKQLVRDHNRQDVSLWKRKSNVYHKNFRTKDTWLHIHGTHSLMEESRTRNRGTYGKLEHNRKSRLCFLQSSDGDTRAFVFSLSVHAAALGVVGKRLITDKYTTDWTQNAIHSIWWERNDRRHGESHSSVEKLVKFIDKNVHNRVNTMPDKDGTLIQAWLASRFH
ncbi:PREDICTED: uncharacterized protein LOC104715105 [Camelina sativa]|uniref:Uncharacterized protein LOC104715105 n=1 Tax=Camelina sativa TaxID=90675 RepID=A0ABM0TT00_CAMSA|nr:PREDICTED: uncharacterized protein LOC104715105 [Camelina sativa]